mmetsp:Transcript_3251/g.5553  ORF Transcript_3251/g.5553 Transcript_3251/m.5553 type:complete len:828 (+) Transcript_3251:287-2770(+)
MQGATSTQGRRGSRAPSTEGWETVPARREPGRSRGGGKSSEGGQARRSANTSSGRSNTSGGAAANGGAGAGAGAGPGATNGRNTRRNQSNGRGMDSRGGEPENETQMFDPETRQRLHSMLDEYIEKKCASNEQCQKSDFDASAREALQRISFLQALQAIEHFASSVSSRILNRPAYLMGILRGQELHWDKSRAAASLPGGSADLLGMPSELMLLIGEFCLVGHCMPSDFTPEVCLALQRLTPPLAVKAVQAFNANKRICAGNRGGVLNRPRFFQRLIQNVADQNSEASDDAASTSGSINGNGLGDLSPVGNDGESTTSSTTASNIITNNNNSSNSNMLSNTSAENGQPRMPISAAKVLTATLDSVNNEFETSDATDSASITPNLDGSSSTTTAHASSSVAGAPAVSMASSTTGATAEVPNAWAHPDALAHVTESLSNSSKQINLPASSSISARSADGSASSVSTGTGSADADIVENEPDLDPGQDAFEDNSVPIDASALSHDTETFATTSHSLTGSNHLGTGLVGVTPSLHSAGGTAGATSSNSWDDSAFGAASSAMYWVTPGIGPVPNEPSTPKSARGRTSSFMTPSPQVHFKDRPQTADRDIRHENAPFETSTRSRQSTLVGSDFLDAAFDTRSRTSSLAFDPQSTDAPPAPWDTVRDRNSSLFFTNSTPGTSATAVGPPGAASSALPRASVSSAADAGVFFSDANGFGDTQFSTSDAWNTGVSSSSGTGHPGDLSAPTAWAQHDGSPASSSSTREPVLSNKTSATSSGAITSNEPLSDLHARVRHLETLCARLEQENTQLRHRQDILTAGLQQLLATATNVNQQ